MNQSNSILTGVPVAALTLPLTPVFPFKQLKGPFANIYYIISLSSLKPASIFFLLEHFPKCLTWLPRHLQDLTLGCLYHMPCRLSVHYHSCCSSYTQNIFPIKGLGTRRYRYLEHPPAMCPIHCPSSLRLSVQAFSQSPKIATSIIPTPFLFYFSLFYYLSLISGCILSCLILPILPYCGPMEQRLICCVHSTI